MMKMKKVQRENDFIRVFNEKKRIANLYKVKYKVHFSNTEFSMLSPVQLIKLGDEKRYRKYSRVIENEAALTIQTSFRRHQAQKKYLALRESYITPYGYSLKDLARFKMAATKIQQFYRLMKHAKEMIQMQEERKVLDLKRYNMLTLFTDYIIQFKYLKPRLYTLLIQLERIIRTKRDFHYCNAAILIQYHIRKFLKKLKEKREVKKPNVIQKKQTLVRKKQEWRNPAQYDNKMRFDPEKDQKIKDNLQSLKKKYKK